MKEIPARASQPKQSSWRHLCVHIPVVSSPREGRCSQHPEKCSCEIERKRQGRKQVSLVQDGFPSSRVSLSGLNSSSPVSEQWHRYSLAQLCDGHCQHPAGFMLQKAKKEHFSWAGTSSFWTKSAPWACPAALLWFLAALRPVLQLSGRREQD